MTLHDARRSAAAAALFLSLPVAMGCGAHPTAKPEQAASQAERDETPGGGSPRDAAGGSLAEMARSVRSEVQWKRYAAFEADLTAALQLTSDELCQEFAVKNCVHEVHLVALGGNDAIEQGMMVPSLEPSATTPAVVDRIVLSGCRKRVVLDREAGRKAAKVFTALDLSKPSPAASEAAVQETIRALYQRLLARDPSDAERAELAQMTLDADGAAVSASDFATLACYALGTSTEFLFF